MAITSREVDGEDYDGPLKTEYTIFDADRNDGTKIKVARNCNHDGECGEECSYIYMRIDGYGDNKGWIGLGTEEMLELVAAMLAVRKESGLD